MGMPMIGSELITPTTGFSVFITCEIARVRSYSSNCSRLGVRNGNAAVRSSMLNATPR